jgi:hypothetical protein
MKIELEFSQQFVIWLNLLPIWAQSLKKLKSERKW